MPLLRSLGEPCHEIRLVGDGVKNVPDKELTRPRAVAAEAALDVGAGGDRSCDHLRRVALGTDKRAVRDHLDSVARYLPLMADISGADFSLARQRLALEWVEVKGHLTECRVPS
jgi:hypothetical protein